MKRRTILQAISAFFASFLAYFGWNKPELDPVRWLEPGPKLPPTGPSGPVSTNAQWFSPATYEVVPSVSESTQLAVQQAAEQFTAKRSPGFVPGFKLEPQKGHEVMRLKNPAVRRTTMGVDYAKKPPASYVAPTGPVAKANTDAWQPLETFQPIQRHPELPVAGVVLGAVHRPATAARFDVSNDTEYRAALDKKVGETSWASLLPPEPAPTPEEQERLIKIRAKQDANYAELEANWGDSRFDPADVARALEEARPLMEEQHRAFQARWGVKS